MTPRGFALLAALALGAPAARAQADYENLDAARPLRVQDAYAVERYAWDVQLGPAVERVDAGGTTWALESAVAWGALPRTQVELVAPLLSSPDGGAGGGRSVGLDGLTLGALHGLNMETLSWPAIALVARVVTPVRSLAPSSGLFTVGGIATRSFAAARLHVNASATIGPSDGGGLDRTRWFAGAAIDRTWPLHALLAAAELFAEQPLAPESPVAWTAGAGVRWQSTPRLVFDGGVSRRFSGNDLAWSATFGVTWSFAVRAFIPVPR